MLIDQGYSEGVMDVSKQADTTGGTVILAPRIESDLPANFMGFAVQAEKEVVSILAPKALKTYIMKAISAACGVTSEAQGLVFSLPVDSVAGLSESSES